MANEAVIISLGNGNGNPVRRTCASGTGISGGALLVLADPNTVTAAGAATVGNAFGGICAMEKDSADGSTTVSAYTTGVFDLTCHAGAGITVGQIVSMSGANFIKTATEAEIAAGGAVGKAEETASASEVIRVRLLGF